ncbi:MAG TPA: signal peptidase II [Chitinophagaceae bacterium]|jgi:signal peptidase II
MNTKSLIRILFIVALIVVTIGCDQVAKRIVRHDIYPYEMIPLLNNHLTVTRVENSGAFLSAGDSLPKSIKHIFLSVIPLIAVVLGLVYIFSKPAISKNMLIGFCFVIGGGIGNLADRIMYGSVTDFLHIKFGIFQTGIFNLADVSIMIGIFIILLQFAFKRNH